MPYKYHPLVQMTKIELERMDKLERVTWEEKSKFYSKYLPISVEPKLRRRALRFMDTLIKKLEENNHSIKFEYERCHIEMYGQLTEINLRQKYFRKRIKDEGSSYSRDTYEKSNKLEFQIGSHGRKGWIDKETKSLEDYLEKIYDYIDKDSLEWAEYRKKQKREEEKREAQKKIEEEVAKQEALEKAKFDKLFLDAENYNKAKIIRSYLKAYEAKLASTIIMEDNHKEYLKWAYRRADELDPLS